MRTGVFHFRLNQREETDMLNYASHFPLSRNADTGNFPNSYEVLGFEVAPLISLDTRIVNSYQRSLHLPITEGRHERR